MDMCNLTLQLKQRGISLIFIKENIHFSASESNLLQELQLHMMSVFSQFERALIRELQAEGIVAKKGRGEKTGRPPADKSNLWSPPELFSVFTKTLLLEQASRQFLIQNSGYI